MVREDALTLYGFESQADRDLFNLLLGVDGVGPKVALSVLSTMTLDAVQRAVFADEADLLSRVPGVGKKTAQKMALHLKDKLKPGDALAGVAAMADYDSEVLAAPDLPGLLGGRGPVRHPVHSTRRTQGRGVGGCASRWDISSKAHISLRRSQIRPLRGLIHFPSHPSLRAPLPVGEGLGMSD